MRLDDLDPTENARDLGSGGGGGFSMGGGGGGLFGILFSLLPMLLGRKLGCGTIAIIAVVGFFLLSSGGLNMIGGGVDSGAGLQQSSAAGNAACDTQEEMFACRVMKSTEDTWGQIFASKGQRYTPATINFFEQSGQSGCGAAQSAMGPFYCPADQGVYLDTSFFRQMAQQMGAGGDFAQAYVVAHEVGHHIQTLTGISDQVRQAQGRASRAEGNALQVRMELQADCYAGVWAGRNRDRIEPGDFEEGMTAANAIGDDTLMEQAGQVARQENFTHGSSEQRMRWLRRGMETGDPASCDTFGAATL